MQDLRCSIEALPSSASSKSEHLTVAKVKSAPPLDRTTELKLAFVRSNAFSD